jgi:hypothetical protein
MVYVVKWIPKDQDVTIDHTTETTTRPSRLPSVFLDFGETSNEFRSYEAERSFHDGRRSIHENRPRRREHGEDTPRTGPVLANPAVEATVREAGRECQETEERLRKLKPRTAC